MFDCSVHERRRKRLLDQMGPNSVAIIGSPAEALRNGDAKYKYRQCSDILYLTGFSEPEATVVLQSGQEESFLFFVRPSDPKLEMWDGKRVGLDHACTVYGADRALPAKSLKSELIRLLSKADEMYYTFGLDQTYDQMIIEILVELRRGERKGMGCPQRIVDLSRVLHDLRLHKDEDELQSLRRAADITHKAHLNCMRAAEPGMGENELEALIEYTFRRNGGSGAGYAPIVGGGNNATVLHYITNNEPLADGDLVLIDAGCEYDFYTADVTRTFPVNGRFSEVQRRCYELVLDAQTQAISMVRPGVTIDELHQRCVEVISSGLVALGLITGTVEDCVSKEKYKKFFMHGSSHWLGMDVHDVGAYRVHGQARPLVAGMVITIEPGLYFANDADVPKQFQGIGIRIEDDIAVTQDGYENLSAAVPKSVSAIEAACQGGES